jgi:hypothetical protein
VPLDAVIIHGYRGVRLRLYEYLALHLGEPVSATRLRALTGDQIHTERRLRELRDLGLRLTPRRIADENHYVLASEDVDFDYAARALAADILDRIPGWSPAQKAAALKSIGLDL